MADFVIRRWHLTTPGPQAPLHVHDAGDEGFIVLDGVVGVTRGAEVVRLTPGEFAIVPAGAAHTFSLAQGEAATVLATMTPEIDELVRLLHTLDPAELPAVWASHHSRLV